MMSSLLKFICGAFRSQVAALAAPRSPKWKAIRAEHLKNHPSCEACGAKKGVVPHHVVPVHVDPSRELDASNLVSLCESATFNCHLFFGHLKRWDRHNINVVEDARSWRARIDEADAKDSGLL